MDHISESQVKYGLEELQKLADKYRISKEIMAKIIMDINPIGDFLLWEPADLFINIYLYDKEMIDNITEAGIDFE